MAPRTSYVTITDLFCGAGGSSIGAAAAGAEIRLALNHWKLAIQTHNSNFPNTDHDCTDVSACDPRRYVSTDILIASPECVNHSLAKGKIRKWEHQLQLFGKLDLDPEEERSRATMYDVCRFAEAHDYRIIIVENVVDARKWVPFEGWLNIMERLGYRYKIVYFNSMFAFPTPQSRDRMYVVFWQKNLRAPDLDITPSAYCPQCGGNVASVQSWKNPKKPWGKYRQQYVYCCPNCGIEVMPYYFCAMNAIDWSIPAQRIGDRKKPLKTKTIRRIKAGLQKFGHSGFLFDHVHTARNDTDRYMVWPLTDAQRTVIGQSTHSLVVPPFLVALDQSGRAGARASVVTDPHPTQTTAQAFAVVTPPSFLVDTAHAGARHATDLSDPTPTQTGRQSHAIVMPFLVDMTRTKGLGTPVDWAYPTQTATELFGLAVPPAFLSSYYGQIQNTEVTEPVPTIPGIDKHALVIPPFVVSYYTRLTGQQAAISTLDNPLPTVPGRAVHYLAEPGPTPEIEDCGFRMLVPPEIGSAMAFPATYRVFGNQRQQVRQFGQAVTPPVMRLLIGRCLAVLN